MRFGQVLLSTLALAPLSALAGPMKLTTNFDARELDMLQVNGLGAGSNPMEARDVAPVVETTALETRAIVPFQPTFLSDYFPSTFLAGGIYTVAWSLAGVPSSVLNTPVTLLLGYGNLNGGVGQIPNGVFQGVGGAGSFVTSLTRGGFPQLPGLGGLTLVRTLGEGINFAKGFSFFQFPSDLPSGGNYVFYLVGQGGLIGGFSPLFGFKQIGYAGLGAGGAGLHLFGPPSVNLGFSLTGQCSCY